MSDSNNKASLGCGTLILIAVIVLIFGNSNNDKDLVREIRALKAEIQSLKSSPPAAGSGELESEIAELKAKIAAQSATLAEIKAHLDEPARLPRPRIVPPSPPQIEAE